MLAWNNIHKFDELEQADEWHKNSCLAFYQINNFHHMFLDQLKY